MSVPLWLFAVVVVVLVLALGIVADQRDRARFELALARAALNVLDTIRRIERGEDLADDDGNG